MALQVGIDGISGLMRLSAAISPQTTGRAIAAGVRAASQGVPTVTAARIRSEYTISGARIKRDITVLPTRGIGEDASSTVVFKRRAPTLGQFQVNPGRRGRQPGRGQGFGWGQSVGGRPLTATVVRGRTQAYPRAFLATVGGNRLVLQRSSSGRGLRGLHGPSVGSIALGQGQASPAIKEAIAADVQERFAKGMQRELDRQARGFGR